MIDGGHQRIAGWVSEVLAKEARFGNKTGNVPGRIRKRSKMFREDPTFPGPISYILRKFGSGVSAHDISRRMTRASSPPR